MVKVRQAWPRMVMDAQWWSRIGPSMPQAWFKHKSRMLPSPDEGLVWFELILPSQFTYSIYS